MIEDKLIEYALAIGIVWPTILAVLKGIAYGVAWVLVAGAICLVW